MALQAALPEEPDHGDSLFEHLLADVRRRPSAANDVLVEVLTCPNAEEETILEHEGDGGGGLRDDRRVDAYTRARDARADAKPFRGLRDSAEDRPHEGALPLRVDPGMEVVGDQSEGEAGLLGLRREFDERARAVFLTGELVAELEHSRCPFSREATPARVAGPCDVNASPISAAQRRSAISSRYTCS